MEIIISKFIKRGDFMNSMQLSTTKDKELVIQSNSISRGIYTCSPLARKLIAYCILNINHTPEAVSNPDYPDIEFFHHFKIIKKTNSF